MWARCVLAAVAPTFWLTQVRETEKKTAMKIEWTRTVVPERDAAGRLRRHAEHEAPMAVQDGGQAQIVEFYNLNMGIERLNT